MDHYTVLANYLFATFAHSEAKQTNGDTEYSISV